tara:strand:- start:162 stop:347 length:186 start_codon:yes stop_codon:yes gene_type:complete
LTSVKRRWFLEMNYYDFQKTSNTVDFCKPEVRRAFISGILIGVSSLFILKGVLEMLHIMLS